MRKLRFFISALPLASAATLLLSSGAAPGAVVQSISPENLAFFENKVRPLLSANCLECHSADKGKVKGGLNMDTREDMLRGGNNGPVFTPGAPKESAMVSAIEWTDDFQMPPKKKLRDEEIAVLKEWIRRGAPDPRDGSTASKIANPADHWAFKPIPRPVLPKVRNEEWCKNSIDRFVLAKLEEKGLVPANPLNVGSPEEQRFNKEALLRRACFDLTGLPPTVEQIISFTSDPAPNAFERVIDALLASPAYGERWARHWMDTARYSDTTGLQGILVGRNYRYDYAWVYRDWLICAINQDMGYDRFLMNQLAADKMHGNNPANLAALGFLTVGPRFKNEQDEINDRIDVVGRGMLGLTITCARCHEHKFDPIKQSDYYALHGVFSSIEEPKEGPVVAQYGKPEEIKAFNEGLRNIENEIYGRLYSWVYEENTRVWNKPAAYFEVALLAQKHRSTPENAKRAEEITAAEHLDEKLLKYMAAKSLGSKGESAAKNPVGFPFAQLFEQSGSDRESNLAQMLAGKSKHHCNPLVLDFLKKAGPLPSDARGVAALFERFVKEKVLVLNAKTKQAERGVLFQKLEDRKANLTPQDRAALEVLMFPFPLLAGGELSESRVKDFVNALYPLSAQLERRLDLPKLNEFKLHSSAQPVRAMVVEDLPTPVESPVYPRGNPPLKGEKERTIPRQFLEVFSPKGVPVPFKEGSGRLELAKAIASKQNPITARVLVNRMWMYHFGEGLVKTPDDLGNQAGKPTHPELLDFLSLWFMEDFGGQKPAWSMKSLHKAIMMSNTYQQSCRHALMEKQQAIDAENSLLWRSNIRRLDFESFRDSLLSMAGALDKTMYGPPVNLVSEPLSYRRSVYGYIDRADMPDLMMQFDMAAADQTNTKRGVSVVPQQALFLMNSPFIVSVVQKIAHRPEIASVKGNLDSSIQAVYRVVLQRTPSQREFEMAREFVQGQRRLQEREESAMGQVASAATSKAQEAAKKAREIQGTKARAAIVNEGEVVQRAPFTPLEALIQALMFSNSAAYLR